jgi:hypothetical protein
VIKREIKGDQPGVSGSAWNPGSKNASEVNFGRSSVIKKGGGNVGEEEPNRRSSETMVI